jgi:hypothetical protein
MLRFVSLSFYSCPRKGDVIVTLSSSDSYDYSSAGDSSGVMKKGWKGLSKDYNVCFLSSV